ncbi:hypothetical protein [Aquabacterium sp.]|uniref:hypothetical protein n=1 Tax=Aquabacterium sp. TaxID=1872578 RepID=UPI0019A97A22|nr:hypothetical protein [Aquabacterium sp.]MBC7699613.1 hypothetical protein [Aquabacterium sp.]
MNSPLFTTTGASLSITLPDGHQAAIDTEFPIIATETSPDQRWLFIVTEPPPQHSQAENLLAFDLTQGQLIWRKKASKVRSRENIFTQVRFSPADGCLLAWDWDGYKTWIEPASGQERVSHFLK